MQAVSERITGKLDEVVQPLANSTRVVWVEYLTILSCFAVIMVHSLHGNVDATVGSFAWWIGNLASSMGRFPVPVFVMISGYFLLDPNRDYTLTSFYKKRATRIFVPLVFWSVFYVVFSAIQSYIDHQPIGWQSFAGPILKGKPYYHMWYLYMLVGLYLFTPFIRKIVSSSKKNELVLLCIMLFLVFMLVNAASFFHSGYYDTSTNGSIFIMWFLSYLGYFLAGYLLGRMIDIKIGYFALIGLLAISIFVTAVGCYILTSRESYDAGQYFVSLLSPTVVVMSISIFFIAKKLFARAPRFKLVASASACMLGIYLMHPFFLACFRYFGFEAMKFNPLYGIPVVTLSVFCICFALSAGIKRIPYFKNVI